jgi:2-polyprenyl-3-methyl-5-hydroxy-6-metoxy-1,4-benzoquinol methylase
MKQWYRNFFENYAESYEKEIFTAGTLGECDFIEQEIQFNKNLKILDIGCGTGRHSIELTKRGYSVTGIDLSESMLAKAKKKAAEQNLNIDFQLHDARQLPFRQKFDMAIMICEGAFPLMETDEMNYQILESASNSLRPGGKLIFTTLNGLFPVHRSTADFVNENSIEGNAMQGESSFDLMTFRDYNITTFTDDDGNTYELECNERYYVPSEVTWLLKSAGFNTIDIFGAKLGAFSRNDKLKTDDFEMLVIAVK